MRGLFYQETRRGGRIVHTSPPSCEYKNTNIIRSIIRRKLFYTPPRRNDLTFDVHKGFSLIELMITMAIIAIIMSIAIPAYQDYQGKSAVSAALAEIRPGIEAYELLVLEGKNDPAFYTANNLGLKSRSSYCSVITVKAIENDGSAQPAIDCTLTGSNSKVNGKTLRYDRLANGEWVCKANTPEAFYRPFGCEGL